MPIFKHMVRAAGPDSNPTYLEMPEHYQFYNSYCKVVDSNTILSLDINGRDLIVETSVTPREQQLAKPIEKEMFDRIFRKHIDFVEQIQKPRPMNEEPQEEPKHYPETLTFTKYN